VLQVDKSLVSASPAKVELVRPARAVASRPPAVLDWTGAPAGVSGLPRQQT